jgi:hypothetical protein
MAGDSWPNSVWALRLSNIEVTSKPAVEVYKEKVSKSRPETEGKSERADGGKPEAGDESK